MKRLLLVTLGTASAVAALRGVRDLAGTHGPAAAIRALGPVAGVTTLAHRALAELRAGTAEREAELRADLLAGADLPHSRARVDAWRAERARARSAARHSHERPDQTADRAAPWGAADRPADAPEPRPGSAAAATPRAARRGTGSHRAEDTDDGSLGYSFF